MEKVQPDQPEREPGYDERHFTARHAEMYGVADETVIAPPAVHYDPDAIGYRYAPCGEPVAELRPSELSADPAKVTCPPCAASLVDGQLAEPARLSEVEAEAEGWTTTSSGHLDLMPAPECTDWAHMPDGELEARLRGALAAVDPAPDVWASGALREAPASLDNAELELAARAHDHGAALDEDKARTAAERRTVGLEVMTDELRTAACNYDAEDPDGKVGIVMRVDGRVVDIPELDTLWAADSRKPADILSILLRQARMYADGLDGNAGAELLMPGPDVLAALAGQPVGSYTAPVPSSYGVVQAGWFVGLETVDGAGEPGVEWALVEDRRSCDRPDCVVAAGAPRDCNVVTVRGRGVQHIETWRPVYVRIPAATEVER